MKNLLKTLKILIVEDEKRLAQLLKNAISDSFVSIVIAKDGNEGLKKFKSSPKFSLGMRRKTEIKADFTGPGAY